MFDEKDLTLRGLEKAKNADKVYAEFYTSRWYGDVKKLEKMIEREIEIVNRKDLEEESDKIIEEAKSKKVVVFVLGDPLVATTHVSLLSDAEKNGIKTEIVHNASIYSAVGETGLHLYKFGRTVTIPFPEKTTSTDTLADAIEKNMKMGKKFFTKNTGIVVFARAGSNRPLTIYGKVKNLIKKDFGDPPFVMIIPGKLHFTEREHLEHYRVSE